MKLWGHPQEASCTTVQGVQGGFRAGDGGPRHGAERTPERFVEDVITTLYKTRGPRHCLQCPGSYRPTTLLNTHYGVLPVTKVLANRLRPALGKIAADAHVMSRVAVGGQNFKRGRPAWYAGCVRGGDVR
jgi:hypothetical protein